MKRPTLANENMVSLYSGRSYISPSSKSPLQTYQKSIGLSFNSPKSEAQKGFGFSQKSLGTNLRASTKYDKPEPVLERKNSKTITDSYTKTSNPALAYGGGITRPNKPRGSSTKATPSDKLKNEQADFGKQYGSKYSEALNLRDSLLKQSTKGRNLEISSEIQAYKALGGVKAYSTKNKDLQSSHIGASESSYSGIDFSAKYMGNQSAINNLSRYEYARTEARTEGNDDKSITPTSTTKQKSALGRILANTSEKGQSGTIRKPLQNDEDNYNPGSPQHVLKVNNFFASSKRKEVESSLQKRDKSLNYSVKDYKTTNDKEEYGRASESKLANRTQLEVKSSYKGFGVVEDSREEIKDARNQSSLTPNKESKSASSVQKSSLGSFITKVEKGSALPIKTKKEDDDSAGFTQNRPYLTLEDKSNSRAGRNASESLAHNSTSTTNADSKTITFNKNKTNQLSVDVPKPKAKSFGLSPTLKDQEDDSEDYTPKKDSFTYYTTSLEKHHRNWNESDYFCQIYKEHFIQSFQALTFCKYLKPVDPKVLAQKKVFLPKRPSHKDKKTIIFDLDETLIHCNESADIPCDVILPIRFPHGEIIEAGINVRPYALECLKEVSQHFEVIVFTASHSCYANVVLDYLDPHGQYVHHRLFRENCVVTDEGIYIKDLRILGNRNLQDIVLVDNAAYSFGYQIENGIPVIPFYDNKDDQELKHLVPYLKSFLSVKDVREVNKQTFKMHTYSMYDSLDKVLNKVVLRN